MDEQRWIEIESKIAFQESTIEELNAVLTVQQQRIADLEALCRQLSDRVTRLGQDVHKGSAADEVPPHY